MLQPPEFLKPYLPQFEYGLVDLYSLSKDSIEGEEHLKAFLFLLKYIQSPELMDAFKENLLPLFSHILKTHDREEALEILRPMLYYLQYKAAYFDQEQVIQWMQQLPEEKQIKRPAQGRFI